MAGNRLGPPELDYIQALKTQMEKAYQLDDAQIDRTRQVRTLERATMVDDRYRVNDVEVRDPTLADETQRVTATLSLNDPRLTVTPAIEGSDTSDRNATLREHWTEEVLRKAGRRRYNTDAFRDAMDAAVGDGGAWTKLLFSSDLWEVRYSLKLRDSEDPTSLSDPTALDPSEYNKATEAAKKAAGPPFVFTCVDAKTVYPIWAGGYLSEMLEIQKRELYSSLRQYRLGLDKEGEIVPEELGVPINKVDASRIPGSLDFTEHWDDTYATYVIMASGREQGGRIVKQFKHKHRRVPYFSAMGYTFNWKRGRKVGWGVGESKRWLVEYLGYMETINAQVTARDAFTPIVRKLPESLAGIYGSDQKAVGQEYWEIRQIYTLRPGEEMQPMQFPGPGPALNDSIKRVKERIEELSAPRVVNEIGGAGLEGAGYAINQVLSESRITQDPIASHVEGMLEEVTQHLWYLMREVVQETVWVQRSGKASGWVGAGPEDLTDDVGIRWEVDPERPSAKLIEERYWHERIEKGTAGRHQAIKELGDNPDEVDDDRELDRLRTTPWYQQRHDMLLLQKLQRGDIIAQAAEHAIQSGNLPGRPAIGLPGQPPAEMPQTQAGAIGPPATQAMGNGVVPDMGNLAVAPGGGAGMQTGPPGAQPIGAGSMGAAGPQPSAAPGARI